MIFELAVLMGTVGGLSAPSWGPQVIAALRRRFGRGARGIDVKSPRYRLGTDTPGPVSPEWLRFGGARPEVRGAPSNSVLAVPGLAKQPPAVRAALLDIAEQLHIPVDSLATVIAHESGWNARATAFYMAGQFGPSMTDIARTLNLNDHHFGALAGLGMILEELGRDEAAIRAYRASLAIHPHQDALHQALDRLEKKTSGRSL